MLRASGILLNIAADIKPARLRRPVGGFGVLGVKKYKGPLLHLYFKAGLLTHVKKTDFNEY